MLAAYRYDAFGNLVAQATQPGGFVSPVGYRGERLDPVLAEYYLRARLYDPRTGRFTSMDEFAGNIVDPLTLHEFLYGDADPVNRSDPSGYFSVSQTLSVQGITNQPNFGLRLVTSALKVYQRVQDLLTLLQFAQKIVRFIKILGEPTVAGMAAALAAAIRSEIGSEEAAVLQGLRQALGTLTPHWKDISKAIRKAIPGIASELSARVAFRIPKYVALQQAGRLKAVFYAPTAPGPRGNEYYIDVGSEYQVAVSPSGGRLFGLGLRTSKKNVDPLFRLDYWDVRPRPPQLLVHYRLIDDPPHPPGRTIWP